MSILQGYSSSSSSSSGSSDDEKDNELPPFKKVKTFAGSFQQILSSILENDTFHINNDRKISNNAKKLAKQLKRQRYKQGSRYGIDPWTNNSSDNENNANNNANNNNNNNENEQNIPSSNIEIEDNNHEEITSVVSTTNNYTFEPSSEFVGEQEFDYQGRSYMTIPKNLPNTSNNNKQTSLNNDDQQQQQQQQQQHIQECFVPKRVIHIFPGHKKGINRLRFFPNSGHLLLSCGNDNLIKLWSIYNTFQGKQYQLLRIFKGHNLPVKDIIFNQSGERFLSCGYDKYIRLWDTKTGEMIKSIKLKSIPNVLLFNPNNKNNTEFIVGLSNFTIEHYDFNSIQYTNPIQIYDHHQGSINDLKSLGLDKFISSSDDKTVRIWSWQINIPIKVITDPSQHSIPCIKIHPQANYIALQSMDNSIKVIHLYGKFKWYKKKFFTGHQIAGYGIEIDFSPDGKILMSGDCNGFAYFWDWKTCKLIKKLKIIDNTTTTTTKKKPLTCIVAHPQETSKVAIAGNSGEIYYCD